MAYSSAVPAPIPTEDTILKNLLGLHGVELLETSFQRKATTTIGVNGEILLPSISEATVRYDDTVNRKYHVS